MSVCRYECVREHHTWSCVHTLGVIKLRTNDGDRSLDIVRLGGARNLIKCLLSFVVRNINDKTRANMIIFEARNRANAQQMSKYELVWM